jgi:hypothetical protein
MEKLIQLLSTVFLLFLLLGCDKAPHDDLSGNEIIRGRLYQQALLEPTLYPTTLAKKKVTLRYSDSKDTLNFLFSTLTDEEGYFTFTNLKADRAYTASYQETVDGIILTSSESTTAPHESLILLAKVSPNQNGIILTLKDHLGNPIRDNDICIFTSPTSVGYLANNCQGSTYKITTDLNGRAKLFGIPPNYYYALSSANVGQIPISGKKMFSVKGKLSKDSLKLTSPNGLIVSLKFEQTPLKETDICLFKTSDNPGYLKSNCEGNSYTAKTDATGKARFFSLPKGIYYMLSTTSTSGMPLSGKQEVEVTENEIRSIDFSLKRPNGIQFMTTDNDGGVIGNVDICLFNSKILFEKALCSGSNYQFKTTSNGSHIQYDLPEDTYYVIATKIIDEKVWIAKGTINLAKTLATIELKLIPK